MRGVVEGFYGPPWSHAERRAAMTFLADRGMNAYVYAPKDDPYHRAHWREPYPADEWQQIVATAQYCASLGVRFGYALSPGLDMNMSAEADREALLVKLGPAVDAGIDWFVLAFDDIPLRAHAGEEHAKLVAWLAEQTAAHLSVVPTDYVGCRASRYLDELCPALPDDVEVMWTGATVVAPRITVEEAEARAAATAGRPILVWDNYPVNDALMAPSLHLGPVEGRDPALAGVVAGILANPMPQARASLIPLATVADFLAEPSRYTAAESWARAIADVAGPGAEAQGAVATLARACASSLLATRVPLHDLLDEWEKGDADAPARLRAELEAAASLPRGLPPEFLDECTPWAEQAAREASVGLAALAAVGGGRGQAGNGAGRDPWSAALRVLGMLVVWNGIRATTERVTFGPRFACYPGIVLGDEGAVRVDPDLSLVEDVNAIDRLCRAALHARPSGP